MNFFSLKVPSKPTITQLAQDELYEAQQAQLKAATQLEFAVANHAAQVARVNRLTKMLEANNAPQQ